MSGLPSIEEVAAELHKEAGTAPEVPVTAAGEAVTDPADQRPSDIATKSNGQGAPSADAVAEAVSTKLEEKAEKPATEKRDAQAARFAALARKEKEARQLREQVEAEKKALEAERAKLAEEKAAKESAKRPLDILKAHGLTYQDAMNDALGGYTPPEPDPIETKLGEKLSPVEKQLKELADQNKALQDAMNQINAERQQRAMQEIRFNIKQTAADKGYEYINEVGDEAYTLVSDVIGDYWHKHKRVLTYDEACGIVDSYYDKLANKVLGTKKVQAKLAGSASASKPASPVKDAKGKPTTLTQGLSTTSVAKPNSGVDHLPKHEALEALKSMIVFE